jgi:serine/threonine-protein kinase RsbT
MVERRFALVEQTKMMTAASELARNAVIYGGGGDALLELLEESGCEGIRVLIEDHGPGIADIVQAMTNGFTSGQGMGLGLGGSKRLVDEFEIWSQPGQGTRVSITRWK